MPVFTSDWQSQHSTRVQTTQQQRLFGNWHISMVLLYVWWNYDFDEGVQQIGMRVNNRLTDTPTMDYMIPQLQITRYPNYGLHDTPTTDYTIPNYRLADTSTMDYRHTTMDYRRPNHHHNLPELPSQ